MGNHWLMGTVCIWDNESVLDMDSCTVWMYLKPLTVESKMI